MNDVTFQKLEFETIRSIIAGHCSCALGKRLAKSMTPTTQARLVQQWFDEVRELADVVEEKGLPPLAGVYDIHELVRASSFPVPLEPDALARVADTLSATGNIRAWFAQLELPVKALERIHHRIADLTSIASVINESIDERSGVRDSASDKLTTLRKTIESARGKIRKVYERILHQTSLKKMLQYSSATFHNDRMVLPLKAEYRGRIQGIVHRSSDSGATLFVEPSESVELNNTIVRLREEERKEITQILKALTKRIFVNAETILSTIRAIGVLDLVVAKYRYMNSRDGYCPQINQEGVLDLHDARHPLLLEIFNETVNQDDPPREVVPIDIRLGDDFDILIITGPNTGGKTVTLKTVGLIALMTQCGIPIPVGKGSTIPVYRNIFVDIGDEQNLQQSLSTFSAHLTHLLKILQRSGSNSLVLLDELGAGTDPDEGAAIGRAIIAELIRLKSKAMLTTHLSSLKAVAYTTARVDNASVEFDTESLKPTYHLRIGEPGNSNALIIAKRLGMSARLIKEAGSYLDDTSRALSKAVAGTLESRREAEAARKKAKDALLEADQQRLEFEKQKIQLADQQQAFEDWTQWVNTLKAGDEVHVRSLNTNAKVVRMQLHKQSALVTSGTMDIEVPLKDIEQPRDE